MSNLEKIAALEKTMLTPADVAEYLESDAESIRLQARANAAALGFPVIVMGNRVKIPKHRAEHRHRTHRRKNGSLQNRRIQG